MRTRSQVAISSPSVAEPQLVAFRQFNEPNGSLVAITGGENLPFEIARVFFVFDVPKGETRGEHAHHQCNQVLFVVRGRVDVEVHDGKKNTRYALGADKAGLWVPPLYWATQRYVETDCVLAVFTDQPFRESDYIRDFEEFKKLVAGSKRESA